MRYASVELRGKQVTVEFRVLEDDPSTNSLAMEWFLAEADMLTLELTDDECESVYVQLSEVYLGDDE
jgi:hypothetical protein